jgi:SsrA-binding protein
VADRVPIVTNRRALHEFEVLERLEAGMVLTGTEVKSLREGTANLRDAYVFVEGGEAFVVGLHIPPYAAGNRYNHEPDRIRKLLLHRREIDRMRGRVQERGLTMVPLVLYWKDGRVKLELGLARGKNVRDKRATEAARDARREIDRAMKERAR